MNIKEHHMTQHQYHYIAAPVIASMPSVPTHYTRTSSTRTTEFRGSTNPDEDWTKISDLAERRRIQNRIAQRNYRKKLKRRLEDLERRAASRSLSPNGEDTDGRSTRESSAEQPLHSPPPSSEPHTTSSPPSSRDSYLPPVSSAYTTSSNYSYRGSYAPTFSSTAESSYSNNYYHHPPPSSSTTVSSSSSTLPAINDIASQQYLFSYSTPLSSVLEATCGTPLPPTTSGSEHSYLPLPSARVGGYSSVAPEYAAPKTAPTSYDDSTTGSSNMSPFYSSYAGLAESPDPSYFSSNSYYDHHPHHHHHHHSHSHHHSQSHAIKQEN